ncbi:hypothetical protein Peur_053781 [Populus x canadensis]
MQLFGFGYLGPFGHFLHLMLEKLFKGKKDTATVAKKVAVEQLTASPWNNLVFMIYYGMVIDGRCWMQVKTKLKKEYPAVQFTSWTGNISKPPSKVNGVDRRLTEEQKSPKMNNASCCMNILCG